MLPDRVSNPGPLTYESGALPIALRGPANIWGRHTEGGDVYWTMSYISWPSEFALYLEDFLLYARHC